MKEFVSHELEYVRRCQSFYYTSFTTYLMAETSIKTIITISSTNCNYPLVNSFSNGLLALLVNMECQLLSEISGAGRSPFILLLYFSSEKEYFQATQHSSSAVLQTVPVYVIYFNLHGGLCFSG